MNEVQVHYLKTWPEYYKGIADQTKKFELRKFDRDFVIGDTLVLQEYMPGKGIYTGRETKATITYILEGGVFGLAEGYCIMSLEFGE